MSIQFIQNWSDGNDLYLSGQVAAFDPREEAALIAAGIASAHVPVNGVLTTASSTETNWGITKPSVFQPPILLTTGLPTFALSAVGAATALAGTTIQTPETSPLFQYSVGDSVSAGNIFPLTTGGNKVSFVTDSPDFEIQVQSNGFTIANFNVMADGQWLSPTQFNPASGASRLRVTFATRKQRLISVTGNIASGQIVFRGITRVSTDSLSAPAVTSSEIWAVCGDSFCNGNNNGINGADCGGLGLGHIVMELLGIERYRVKGVGGSGYTSNSWTTQIDDIIPLAPTKLLFLLGTNDIGQTVALNTTNAGLVFDKVRAALPQADIIVVTTLMTNSNLTADNSTLGTVAAASTRPWINLVNAHTNKYVTGNGRQGFPANDGNGDIVRSSDLVHPSAYGQTYLGQRIAEDIMRIRGLLG